MRESQTAGGYVAKTDALPISVSQLATPRAFLQSFPTTHRALLDQCWALIWQGCVAQPLYKLAGVLELKKIGAQ